MMITTKITVTFKLPEEFNLMTKFFYDVKNSEWRCEAETMSLLGFTKEETVHIKVKEGK